MAKRTPTAETIADDIFGADCDTKPWADGPVVKIPGDFRRRGKDGPPMVPDPSADAELVKSGARKGLPKLVTYARPSGYADVLENSYGLRKWENRCGVAGFGHDPTLPTRAAELARAATSLSVKDQTPEWRAAADRLYLDAFRAGGGEYAANLGTFFHAVTEAEHKGHSWLTQVKHGIDLGLDEETTEAMLAAYRDCIERHGLIVHGAEIRLVNDAFEVAGTTDLEVELTEPLPFARPDGEIVVLEPDPEEHVTSDLKTGDVDPKHCHAYCTQLALYSSAEHRFDTETEQRIPRPFKINQRWGLILWCPVGEALRGAARCDLVLVDLELGLLVATAARTALALYERSDGFALSTRVAAPPEEFASDFTRAPDESKVPPVPEIIDSTATEVTTDDDPFDGLYASPGIIEAPRGVSIPPVVVPDIKLTTAPVGLLTRIAELSDEARASVDLAAFMKGIDLSSLGGVTQLTEMAWAMLASAVTKAEDKYPVAAVSLSAHERYGDEPAESEAGPGKNTEAGMSWDQEQATAAFRSYITRRIEAFKEAAPEEAREDFTARMKASGIPPMKRAGHSNGQLRIIETTLALVEWSHKVTPPSAVVTVPPVNVPEEGRTLSDAERDEFAAAYLALSAPIRSRVDAWAVESAQAGLSVHMAKTPTERRALNLNVRITLAGISSDEIIRAALAWAVNGTWPHMPSLPLGAVIGALTIPQATCLLDVAHLLSDETPVAINDATQLTELVLDQAA